MAYQALEKLINLHDGYRRPFRLPRGEVLLIQSDGERYLVDRHCPHAGQPLDAARIHENRLVCPRHELCFSLHTGAPTCGATPALGIHTLVYEGNTIGVDIDV